MFTQIHFLNSFHYTVFKMSVTFIRIFIDNLLLNKFRFITDHSLRMNHLFNLLKVETGCTSFTVHFGWRADENHLYIFHCGSTSKVQSLNLSLDTSCRTAPSAQVCIHKHVQCYYLFAANATIIITVLWKCYTWNDFIKKKIYCFLQVCSST